MAIGQQTDNISAAPRASAMPNASTRTGWRTEKATPGRNATHAIHGLFV